MEATVAASVPPTQATALSAQTSPKKNKTIRKNITADHEALNVSLGAAIATPKQSEATRDFQEKTTSQQQSPKTTAASTQEFWKKGPTVAPTSPQETLPAVQDFLQKAYETVQRSQQKAVASQPSPIIATALVQHSMQSVFISTPLIPKIATAAPLPFQQASSSVIVAQQSLYRSLTVGQGSLPKAEAAPEKSTAQITPPTMTKNVEHSSSASQEGQSANTNQMRKDSNTGRTGATSKAGQSGTNYKARQPKLKSSPGPGSPQVRSVLVAKRRKSPSAKVESETSEAGQSEEAVKDKSSSESEKTSSTPSPQTSKTESLSESPSTQSEQTPKDSPIKQGTSRVAQTFLTYKAAQKGHHANGPQTSTQKKTGPRSPQSEAGGSARPNGGRRPREPEPDIDPKRMVLVTEFPPYTQIPDLLRVLLPFGPCHIDKCRNRLAVVIFDTEEAAQNAIKATNELCIYGDFLEIKPYTNSRDVDELFRAYKKVISTQKGQDIIQPDKIDLSGDFYQQVENIQNAIRLTRDQVEAVTNLYVDLEMVLQQEWPGCVAVPFGSIPTGLGIKSSDADCFVQLPGPGGGGGGGARAAAFVQRARRLLALYPRVFANLVAIPRANTPILKFRHLPSGFHCDVSAKTPLGAQNSKLIKLLLDHDARLPPVALLLKYWAKVHELSGTGRLTNYALTMMVVFYLQRARALLPAVARLQGPAERLLLDHWDAGFSRRLPPPAACPAALPDLLGGFFQFYAGFDFERLVVCPYLGVPVLKALFDKPDSLPAEFARYAANVRARLAGPLRHATAFCVQDPFEQSHNVASAVSARLALDIRAHLRHAADAYAADRGTFFRTALTTRPRLPRERAPPATRVCLLPRLRAALAPPDWRACVRDLLLGDIFDRILMLRVQRDPAREQEARALRRPVRARHEGKLRAQPPADAADREMYSAEADKPVWRRRRNYAALDTPERLVRRQRAATEELASALPACPLRFELELWFAEQPRSCFVFARLVEGDGDAFRGLVAFMHTAMFDWFRILVRPHLLADPPPPAPHHAAAAELTRGLLAVTLTDAHGDGDGERDGDSDGEESTDSSRKNTADAP